MTTSSITKIQGIVTSRPDDSLATGHAKRILPSTKVSPVNIFSDDTWSYHEEGLRGSLTYRWESEIRWNTFRGFLRDSLITDLKVLTYVCIRKHFALSIKRGVKPTTVLKEVKRLIAAMKAHLKLEHINYLSDVTISEWKSLLSSGKSTATIQAILRKIAHPTMGEYLSGGQPSLKSHHIRGLHPAGSDSNATVGLPSELFGVLSNISHRVVLVFLTLVNLPVSTPDSKHILQDAGASPDKGKLLHAFNEYKQYVCAVRANKLSDEKRKQFIRQFKERFGMHPRVFLDYLRLVHSAALIFVALYTGMRASELRLLRRGGLFSKNGRYFIRSTVAKHRALANAIDCDQWVATDALVDAMRCLEKLSAITGSQFLSRRPTAILGSRKVNLEATPSEGEILTAMQAYFKVVVPTGPYAKWKLGPQQMREGLAEQMARMHVKMPYASMQLKHLAVSSQRALRGLPANVTIRYGNYPRTLLSTAAGADAVSRVKKEQVNSLFGAGRGFAGGGAERHREKVEAYFAGMGLEGKEREEFISNIASHVSVYASGIGFCSLNLLNDRDTSAPPCLGDLQCNPSDCSNSVVPEYNRPAIEIRLEKCDEAEASGQFVDIERLQRLKKAYSSMLEQLDGK